MLRNYDNYLMIFFSYSLIQNNGYTFANAYSSKCLMAEYNIVFCSKSFTENWDSKVPSVRALLVYLETMA